MNTRELSATCGVTPRQLQWWDEQGILSPAIVDGSRVYTDADAARCLAIATLRRKGLSLAGIRWVLRKLPAAGYAIVKVKSVRRPVAIACDRADEALTAAIKA